MKTLEDFQKERIKRERTLVNELTKTDYVFHRLSRNTRHWAHEGRMFVAWQAKDGQPQIRALLRISNFALNVEQGLRIQVDVSTPDGVSDFWLNERPRQVAGLDLYAWVQAHTDVRFIPLNPDHPGGKRSLQVSFMSRSASRWEDDRKENALCFDTVAAFSKHWPQHAF